MLRRGGTIFSISGNGPSQMKHRMPPVTAIRGKADVLNRKVAKSGAEAGGAICSPLAKPEILLTSARTMIWSVLSRGPQGRMAHPTGESSNLLLAAFEELEVELAGDFPAI